MSAMGGMNQLRKFVRLTPGDRRLLLTAALVHGAIRLGLLLLPFRTLLRLITSVTRAPARAEDDRSSSTTRVMWAVTAASRHTPTAGSCLSQALTAEVLLRRQGHPACLRVGVGRSEQGEFVAHAWVESRGQPLVEGSAIDRYSPLPSLEGPMP
jgi:hypothetical protein